MVIKIIAKEIKRVRAHMALLSNNPELYKTRTIELMTLRRVLGLLIEEKIS